ncbi:MAG: class I SAM-dependent methyltransferase [Parvularculaceae bacterium]
MPLFRSKVIEAVESLKGDVAQANENLTAKFDRLSANNVAVVDTLSTRIGQLNADLTMATQGLTAGFGRLDADFVKSIERVDATLRSLGAPSPEQTAANAVAYLVSAAAGAPAQPPIEAPLPHPFSNMSREEWSKSIKRWLAHAPKLLAECKERPCPACKSGESAFLFTSHDGYPFHECSACGAWFVPLRVNRALFERYFAVCPEGREMSDYMLAPDESESAKRFEDYYSELRALRGGAAGALIDIGCGVGASLDAAAALGFEACGVEISVAARMAAAEKGRRVFATLSEAPDKKFDIISLWESLEHMETPDEIGAFAAQALAPNGLLAITVPNLNSPVVRGMRADSLHINGGSGFAGHMNLFSLSALTTFLSRHGFEVVRARGQYSMNVFEVVGYHLGLWRGARDYLESTRHTVALPARVYGLLNVIGPSVADWEREFAMGPILRVIARRKG